MKDSRIRLKHLQYLENRLSALMLEYPKQYIKTNASLVRGSEAFEFEEILEINLANGRRNNATRD